MSLPTLGFFRRFVTLFNFSFIITAGYFDRIITFVRDRILCFQRNRNTVTNQHLIDIFKVYVYIRLAPDYERLTFEYLEACRIIRNYGFIKPLMQLSLILPNFGELRVGPIVINVSLPFTEIRKTRIFIDSTEFASKTVLVANWYSENSRTLSFGTLNNSYTLTVNNYYTVQVSGTGSTFKSTTILNTTATEKLSPSISLVFGILFSPILQGFQNIIEQSRIFFKIQATVELTTTENNVLVDYLLHWFYFEGGCGNTSEYRNPKPDFGPSSFVPREQQPVERQVTPGPTKRPSPSILTVPNATHPVGNTSITSQEFQLLERLVNNIRLNLVNNQSSIHLTVS